jgi:hypothetical protein
MLLILTKLNGIAGNEKKVYINADVMSYYHAYSKDPKEGSEMHMANGEIIRIQETPEEIWELLKYRRT